MAMETFCRIETTIHNDKMASASTCISYESQNKWCKTYTTALKLTPEEEKTVLGIYERVKKENPPNP